MRGSIISKQDKSRFLRRKYKKDGIKRARTHLNLKLKIYGSLDKVFWHSLKSTRDLPETTWN